MYINLFIYSFWSDLFSIILVFQYSIIYIVSNLSYNNSYNIFIMTYYNKICDYFCNQNQIILKYRTINKKASAIIGLESETVVPAHANKTAARATKTPNILHSAFRHVVLQT